MSLIKPINIYIILVVVQVIRLSVGWRKKNACRADVKLESQSLGLLVVH